MDSFGERLRKLLLIISITAAVICAAVIVLFVITAQRDRQKNMELREEIMQTEPEVPGSAQDANATEDETAEVTEPENEDGTDTEIATETRSATPPESETETEQETTAYISPVDFGWLNQVNPEIYAWLEIDGTDISFPVAEHEDTENRVALCILRRMEKGTVHT